MDRRIFNVIITDLATHEVTQVAADRYEIVGVLREALYEMHPGFLNTQVADDPIVVIGGVIDTLVYNLTQDLDYATEARALALQVTHTALVPANRL